MKYAVITSGGKQYRVEEGETIAVDKLAVNPEETYTFSDVLLIVDDKTKKVGTPTVEGAKVTATVVSQGKGRKVRVAKYKAKVRYRKVIGFRPMLTTVKIDKITEGK